MTYDHVLFDIWEVSLKNNKKAFKTHLENIKLSLFGIFKSETLLSDWM